ncbi:hypothetical protein LEMLEM_LOCUS24599 [Lemmus lemmus]
MSGPIWCHDQGEDAKTIFICQNYLHCVPKCNHFEKHHQNVYVCLSLFQGCTVKATEAGGTKKQVQKF